ncbi:MAG: hypothetical protein ACI4O7_12585 [Aristaeellaceae bacterium]
MDEERFCCECEAPIEEDDEDAVQLEDGSWVCSCCFDEYYITCEICDAVVPVDDSAWWGDARICAACLEERCPSFDAQENLRETAAAYEAFKTRYLGRRVVEALRGKTGPVRWQLSDETEIRYEMTVTIDDDCRIADLSPIQAEMLLSEGFTSSDWRPYAVCDDDYDDAAEEIEQVLRSSD